MKGQKQRVGIIAAPKKRKKETSWKTEKTRPWTIPSAEATSGRSARPTRPAERRKATRPRDSDTTEPSTTSSPISSPNAKPPTTKPKPMRKPKRIGGRRPSKALSPSGDIYDDLTERAEHCCGESKFDVVVGTNVSSFGFGDNDRKEKEIFETKTPEETVRKFYELIAKYKADGTLGDCVIAVEDDNEYDQVTILAEYDGKETKSVSEVCWC
jgi:hypothetical protein